MNKKGTIKYEKLEQEYFKNNNYKEIIKYIKSGKTIDKKDKKLIGQYFDYINNIFCLSQTHGNGYFDIRYQILKNPNWSIEEKRKLVYDFYYDDEDWINHLNAFEIRIINDEGISEDSEYFLSPYYLFDYSYEDILKLCINEKIAEKIWAEIEFCRQMNEIRPPKSNKNLVYKKR